MCFPPLGVELSQLIILYRPIIRRTEGGVAAKCFRSSYGYLPLVRRPTTADVVALARDEARIV